MDNNITTILVCAHKFDPYTRNVGVYKAIQVGKALHSDVNLGYINDNSGDNISIKNSKYCEWTALYWGWKNLKNVEYAGLCHYRRYFDVELTNETIRHMLRDCDIILTNERISSVCNFDVFQSCVGIENAFLLVDTILTIYPNADKCTIDYLLNCNHYSQCSMFIAKKEIYDAVCEFVFPILDLFEKRIPEMPYSRMNRAVAYAGELLLGLFVRYRSLRIRYVPMMAIGEGVSSFNYGYISNMWNNIVFRLNNHQRKTSFNIWPSVKVGFKTDGILLNCL